MAEARRRTASRSRLVLVVEDEETVRTLAEAIIASIGFRTLSAANAREALALIAGATIDVLFTDINLPDGTAGAPDGLSLAEQAVGLQPHLHVIYTSGGEMTDGMRALFVEGAGFIPKPYTPDQLAAALESPKAPPRRQAGSRRSASRMRAAKDK